jgi:serine/threonine protein kinase
VILCPLSSFLSDLKPENILYESPDDNSRLKLADFGLASILKPNQLMTVACGTPGYVAPEILKGTAYGKQVDIWSIGVILYILLCGFPPFYDDNNKKLFAQIINANYTFPDPYWTNISPQGKDLVSKLLIVDPNKRLTAEQILQHPWMHEDGSKLTLEHFKPNLKSYNARRRFRSAIRAVQITNLLRKLHPAQDSSEGFNVLAAVEADARGEINFNDPSDTNVRSTSFKSPTDTDSEDENSESTIKTSSKSHNATTKAGNTVKMEKIPEAGSEAGINIAVSSPTIKV